MNLRHLLLGAFLTLFWNLSYAQQKIVVFPIEDFFATKSEIDYRSRLDDQLDHFKKGVFSSRYYRFPDAPEVIQKLIDEHNITVIFHSNNKSSWSKAALDVRVGSGPKKLIDIARLVIGTGIKNDQRNLRLFAYDMDDLVYFGSSKDEVIHELQNNVFTPVGKLNYFLDYKDALRGYTKFSVEYVKKGEPVPDSIYPKDFQTWELSQNRWKYLYSILTEAKEAGGNFVEEVRKLTQENPLIHVRVGGEKLAVQNWKRYKYRYINETGTEINGVKQAEFCEIEDLKYEHKRKAKVDQCEGKIPLNRTISFDSKSKTFNYCYWADHNGLEVKRDDKESCLNFFSLRTYKWKIDKNNYIQGCLEYIQYRDEEIFHESVSKEICLSHFKIKTQWGVNRSNLVDSCHNVDVKTNAISEDLDISVCEDRLGFINTWKYSDDKNSVIGCSRATKTGISYEENLPDLSECKDSLGITYKWILNANNTFLEFCDETDQKHKAKIARVKIKYCESNLPWTYEWTNEDNKKLVVGCQQNDLVLKKPFNLINDLKFCLQKTPLKGVAKVNWKLDKNNQIIGCSLQTPSNGYTIKGSDDLPMDICQVDSNIEYNWILTADSTKVTSCSKKDVDSGLMFANPKIEECEKALGTQTYWKHKDYTTVTGCELVTVNAVPIRDVPMAKCYSDLAVQYSWFPNLQEATKAGGCEERTTFRNMFIKKIPDIDYCQKKINGELSFGWDYDETKKSVKSCMVSDKTTGLLLYGTDLSDCENNLGVKLSFVASKRDPRFAICGVSDKVKGYRIRTVDPEECKDLVPNKVLGFFANLGNTAIEGCAILTNPQYLILTKKPLQECLDSDDVSKGFTLIAGPQKKKAIGCSVSDTRTGLPIPGNQVELETCTSQIYPQATIGVKGLTPTVCSKVDPKTKLIISEDSPIEECIKALDFYHQPIVIDDSKTLKCGVFSRKSDLLFLDPNEEKCKLSEATVAYLTLKDNSDIPKLMSISDIGSHDSFSSAYSKAQSLLTTGIDLLVNEFRNFIITLSRDVVMFNYRHRELVTSDLFGPISYDTEVPLHSKKGLGYARQWRDALYNFNPGESGQFGWGLYGANNPVSSQGYSKLPNWSMVTVTFPKGARLFDVRRFDSDDLPMSPATKNFFADRCSKINSWDGTKISKNDFTYSAYCHQVFVGAMNKLKIDAVVYGWGDATASFCDNQTKRGTFVSVGADLNIDNVRVFTNHFPQNPTTEEWAWYERIHYIALDMQAMYRAKGSDYAAFTAHALWPNQFKSSTTPAHVKQWARKHLFSCSNEFTEDQMK